MIKTMSQRFSQHFMAFMAKLTSKYSIYLILIAMLIICSILSPAFFSAKNLSNISRQISITTIISFGMTMLIIAGLIDLVQSKDIPADSHVLYAHLGGQPAINAYHSLWDPK